MFQNNFIKLFLTTFRLFKKICDENDAIFSNLLYYCECRWLSRGKSLTREFEMREEILELLKNLEVTSHLKFFEDKIWLLKLCYLGEIFEQLNIFNTQLQGSNITKYHVFKKIKSLSQKIDIWLNYVKNGNLDPFPKAKEYVLNMKINISMIKKTYHRTFGNA